MVVYYSLRFIDQFESHDLTSKIGDELMLVKRDLRVLPRIRVRMHHRHGVRQNVLFTLATRSIVCGWHS